MFFFLLRERQHVIGVTGHTKAVCGVFLICALHSRVDRFAICGQQ